MKKIIISVLIFLAAALPCCAAGTHERVLSFDAVLKVLSDGSAVITEEITVNAQGKEIRRGLVRVLDFDTEKPVEIISLEKDGNPHPYSTERHRRDIEVNFGDDTLLPPGIHKYKLSYIIKNAVDFYEDYDEIDWAITGDGWDLPIERASAEIIPPAGANITRVKIWPFKTTEETSPLKFELTQPLGNDKFSIQLPWQKGVLKGEIKKPRVPVCDSWGRECVVSFDVSLEVRSDASAAITEEITVNAEGGKIRRGIVRVLPWYIDVPVKVISLEKDGKPHPYFIESINNTREVNFGDDTFLTYGLHTYKLSYIMQNAADFFKDYDEINWNVTGSDWDFPIKRASLAITLPQGANAIQDKISTYTGPVGSKTTMAVQTGPLRFETTQKLSPGEDFTVAVPWQKGVIKRPLIRMISYIPPFLTLILFIVFIINGLAALKRIGRKPRLFPVPAEYAPPKDVSPAFMRTIIRRGADSKAFSAAVISLAMKGKITITEETGGRFSSTKTFLNKIDDNIDNTFGEERLIMDMISGNFEISETNYSKLQSTMYSVQKQLDDGSLAYIKKNGLDIAILAGLILCMFSPLILGLFLYTTFALINLAMIAFAIICFIIFCRVIDKYTEPGHALLNEIRGFERYMSIAEEGRVALSNPTDAERIFADYLPYAFALDMENQWFKKFDGLVSAAAIERAVARAGGTNFVRGHALSSAISRAAPRSSGSSGGGSRSSGSGGGGSSGGGGRGR